jgi:hypothetical protein
MPSFWMLRRVALVRTDVSEECIASIISVTIIGELGTSLAVTSNWSTLRRRTMHLLFIIYKQRVYSDILLFTPISTALIIIFYMYLCSKYLCVLELTLKADDRQLIWISEEVFKFDSVNGNLRQTYVTHPSFTYAT